MKNNRKEYKYWVVLAGKIVGGNEYREDAQEFMNDINTDIGRWPHLGMAKTYARAGLKRLGLDPDRNSDWGEPKEWRTQANPAGLPPSVERYAKETREGNPAMPERQVWAVAWSRYCRYKDPKSTHCHLKRSEYFPGRGGKGSQPKRNPAKIIPFPGPLARKAQRERSARKALDAASLALGTADWFDGEVRMLNKQAAETVFHIQEVQRLAGMPMRPHPAIVFGLRVLEDVNGSSELRLVEPLLHHYEADMTQTEERMLPSAGKMGTKLDWDIGAASALLVSILLVVGAPEAQEVWRLLDEEMKKLFSSELEGAPKSSAAPTGAQVDTAIALKHVLDRRFGAQIVSLVVEPGHELAAAFGAWSVVVFPGPKATTSTMGDLEKLGVLVSRDGGYVPAHATAAVRAAVEQAPKPRASSRAPHVASKGTVELLEQIPIGANWESGLWRAHRWASSFALTYLENAGKRGKKVESFHISSWPDNNSQYIDAMLSMLVAASHGASPDAVRAIGLALGPQVTFEERESRGVDVDPPGHIGVSATGSDGTTVSASPTDFMVRGTDVNECRLMPAHGHKKDIKKAYEWVRDHLSAIPSMTFGQIQHALSEHGVQSHFYCAMD